MTQPEKPVHPGSYCSINGDTGFFKTGRGAICSAKTPGDRLRWRASGPPPAKSGRRKSNTTPLGQVIVPEHQFVLLPLPVETPAVQTWEELGKPQGPAPLGQVIGYHGGTYELLPGDPRRYKVTSADGRDISGRVITTPGRHQTAEDVSLPAVQDTTPAPADNPTGWSKAARRRFRRGGRSNPLGTRTGGGTGYTTYQDAEFGGGPTQIWDKS